MTQAKKIYLIAGEDSGDTIGGEIMSALISQFGEQLSFAGIGGANMEPQGFISLFPMQELSVMGFAEILPKIPKMLQRVTQTVDDILQRKPDLVITIDSPGFTTRVAAKLRAKKFEGKIMHIVAPSVWAYKPGRAKKFAKLFDHLLVLLPFEPPYFEKEGLPTTFIGHPVAWNWRERADGSVFRRKHQMADNALLLAMLPGSRKGEIARHLPVFAETASYLHVIHRTMKVVMIATESTRSLLVEKTKKWDVPVAIVGQNSKKEALAGANVALVKSGTVTLEVALAQVPMLTTYKINPISAMLLKPMLNISQYNLVNILAEKPIVPEYMQSKCKAKVLGEAIDKLWMDKHAQKSMVEAYYEPLKKLQPTDGVAPGLKAAQVAAQLMGLTGPQ